MIKAIFYDVDGTLYSHHAKKIPDSTLRALHLLKEKGYKQYIATGRHMIELEQLNILSLFEFDGYITLNGQYCLEDDQCIYDQPINKEDIQCYLEAIKDKQIATLFIEKDYMYMNLIDDYTYQAHDAISTPVFPVKENITADQPIYQMCPYTDVKELKDYLKALLPHCSLTAWHPYAMDICPKGGTKVTGIKKIIERHHISADETMSFGDGHNDLEMMDFTGISIAMGNADKKVKDKSSYVTTAVDDDGIFNALTYFKLL